MFCLDFFASLSNHYRRADSGSGAGFHTGLGVHQAVRRPERRPSGHAERPPLGGRLVAGAGAGGHAADDRVRRHGHVPAPPALGATPAAAARVRHF